MPRHMCRTVEATAAQVKAMTGQESTTSEEINLLRKSKRRSAPVKKSTKGSTAKPELVSGCRFCGKQRERTNVSDLAKFVEIA